MACSMAVDSPPPSRDQAAVWLFGTQVPAGRIRPEHAALAARVLALSSAAEVPAALAGGLLGELEQVVNHLGS